MAERFGVTAVHEFHDDGYLFRTMELMGPDWTWVPLEIGPGAVPLAQYEHPEKVVYVLGPQIGTIPVHVLDRLSTPVTVETHPLSPTLVLPTPVVLAVVLHHRLVTQEVTV